MLFPVPIGQEQRSYYTKMLLQDVANRKNYSTIESHNNETSYNELEFEEKLTVSEIYRTVDVTSGVDIPWWKTLSSFIGPGSLIAVGYMDPGNWSTDVAAGSTYGYSLLSIVLLSSIMAMFLQTLAIKCGLATSRDLAQACREFYPKSIVYILWIIIEIAIVATDLAEVIGSAIALKLLFNIPIIYGVILTAADSLIFLFLYGRNIRIIECVISVLILIITLSLVTQLFLCSMNPKDILKGMLPDSDLFYDKKKLFVAIGIVGATVMPHNFYLHSSLVLSRKVSSGDESIQEAIKYTTIDSHISLTLAGLINCAILILAGATFHQKGFEDTASLERAYELLDAILGSNIASGLFAISLLATGLNSTITGTMAGQIVMEGFITLKVNPFYRRMFTRLLAIAPCIAVIVVYGDEATTDLLIISQIVQSFALPFTIFPLIHITSDSNFMGVNFKNSFATTILALVIAVLIVSFNFLLVF